MQEVDHQKKRLPYLRASIVNQLQSESGNLSKCVELGLVELLGAHQGERLIRDRNADFIDVTQAHDMNLANDVALINVALFWNAEIGIPGSVMLLTGDRGCLRMAKKHHLPAASLQELDVNLRACADAPWTASLIRKCNLILFYCLYSSFYSFGENNTNIGENLSLSAPSSLF